MLNNISKILTGDMLKVLCDMGHGDEIVLADANFPAETYAKNTIVGRVIRCSGVSADELFRAILGVFPLDVGYTDSPVCVMDLTDGDKKKGVPEPTVWRDFAATLHTDYSTVEIGKLERFEFYDRSQRAYAIIQTGEEKQYGNLLLVKGVVK